MKTTAAVLRSPTAPFTLEQVELSGVGPNELLVEVAGVGMCHTDLLAKVPEFGANLTPLILGHEGSGVVLEVGASVTNVSVGDHVVLSFASCGQCDQCVRGVPAYCRHFEVLNVTGRRADGSVDARSVEGDSIGNRWFGQSSFARHAIVAERDVVVVDKSLPLELLAPLGCGLQTGAGVVLNVMRLSAGQSIAVFGAGAVGLAAVMAAKAAGASDIVAIDLHDSRLDLAKELGATHTVRGDSPDLVELVRNGTSGVDFSCDTTGVANVVSASVEVLDIPGTAVLVGAAQDDLRIAPAMLVGRTVTYAIEGAAVPRLFLPRLIDLWQRGLFPFDKLIRTYPLSDIALAESDSLSGATVKPVLLPR
ncbi:NAD(P)-dependent alcohol dehydrogenase [Nocardia sp. bgisy134]|uniref:NAD(P)-dependent alcohol dehydrogenase n=1 Tax=Nocardia sp. bgisy134 TaxID=3413789 RepID=UPI003D753A06